MIPRTWAAALDEAVDLYSLWIDACEAVNEPDATPMQARQAQAPLRRVQRGSDEDEDDEDDDAPPPARRPAATNVDDDDDDGDEELPDIPGRRPAPASTSNGKSAAAAAVDEDEEEDQDADASIDRSEPVDMGYERAPMNAKMAALLEQRKAKATQVADNSDEDE
jgi:transcription elongation factor Elf1